MRAIDCGTLIDGTGAAIDDARLLIEGGRIEAVGPGESVDLPDGVARDRYPDATVIPGLIDAHVHLQGVRSMDPMDWVTGTDAHDAARATADLRALAEAGFTTVRDLGSTTGLGLKRAVADGEITGPRVATSGQGISQTGGHGDVHELPYEWASERGMRISTVADGVAECRQEARKRARAGADCLKIMTTGGILSARDGPDQPQFTGPEIEAMVTEAHRAGMPVAAHAQGATGIELALDHGVDTIEHGFTLTPSICDRLVETGTVLVATLSINHRIVERGADHGVPPGSLEKMEGAAAEHFESVRRAHEAGVSIALGTDFMGPDLVPHGENAMEARLLVEEIGLTEMEAIEAGTRVAARTLPYDDVGTLEAGQRADMAVLADDPLVDISALESVTATYRDGQRVT